jgi:PAS domain S-box-containing protein
MPGVERRGILASTEQLLDSAPDGVVIIDGSGTIRLVNRQAEVMFGYRREELLGRALELLIPDRVKNVHPNLRSMYFQHPTTRLMGAGIELSARRKDGSEFPVDISLSSLDTEDGVLVSAAVRDITDRRRMEEERAQLEDRLQTVGQLAGGIAHDFNNLLGGITNYAGLVATTLEEEAGPWGLAGDAVFRSLQEDVAEITNVAQRAAALAKQLLIFSRRDDADLPRVLGDVVPSAGRAVLDRECEGLTP